MKPIYLLMISLFLLNACASRQIVDPIHQDTIPDTIIPITGPNFNFTAVNNYMNAPDKDVRVFYRIFINKEEYGRTTTGLQSQRKIFEASLPENRHLLRVEKWVLNNDEYIRANNILQPRPDFVYFDVVANRITNVVLSVNNNGQYEFSVEIDR